MDSQKALRAFQEANRGRTVEQIEAALAEILAETEKNGFYPHNKGRIDKKEICRRAGVSTSTLKNATHATTSDRIERWLDKLKKKAPIAKAKADDAKRERISDLTNQVEIIANNYNLFKIQYDALLEENDRLKTEIASLRQQVSMKSPDSKVVSLRPDRKPN